MIILKRNICGHKNTRRVFLWPQLQTKGFLRGSCELCGRSPHNSHDPLKELYKDQ